MKRTFVYMRSISYGAFFVFGADADKMKISAASVCVSLCVWVRERVSLNRCVSLCRRMSVVVDLPMNAFAIAKFETCTTCNKLVYFDCTCFAQVVWLLLLLLMFLLY